MIRQARLGVDPKMRVEWLSCLMIHCQFTLNNQDDKPVTISKSGAFPFILSLVLIQT
jgi:hypothetical protein